MPLLIFLLTAFVALQTGRCWWLDVAFKAAVDVVSLESSNKLFPLGRIRLYVYLQKCVPEFDLAGLGRVFGLFGFCELHENFVVFVRERTHSTCLHLIEQVKVVVRDRAFDKVDQRFLF